MANHFFDTISKTVIMDAPPDSEIDLPGDGSRAGLGVALLAACAAMVVAVAGWAVVIIAYAWPDLFGG